MQSQVQVLVKITFGQWLKLRRQIVHVSQGDIAKSLNITRQSVSSWEQDKTPPSLNPRQTKELCDLLKVDLDKLVKGFEGDIDVD